MESTLLDTWHIINKRWVHLAQVLKDGEISYYVDGVLSGTFIPKTEEVVHG